MGYHYVAIIKVFPPPHSLLTVTRFSSSFIISPYSRKFLAWIAEKSPGEYCGDFDNARMGNLVNQSAHSNEANGQFEKRNGRNGICSHEVLQDGEPVFDSQMIGKVVSQLPPC